MIMHFGPGQIVSVIISDTYRHSISDNNKTHTRLNTI